MSSLVAGVVILWGRIELHGTGMRAAHARIVGLELPMSRGGKRRELERVAQELGVPAVTHHKLRTLGPSTASRSPARSVRSSVLEAGYLLDGAVGER